MLIKRVSNLLTVKSIVTLLLTLLFAYLAITKTLTDEVMTIYSIVIAFYFGTQSRKEPENPNQ